MEALCQRCSKPLQTPFWKCIAGHPLCPRCSREVQGCPACQASDTAAATALQGMQHLTCRFNYRKCAFVGAYEELQKHEAVCPYGEATFPCFIRNCEWNGVKVVFSQHLLEDHKLDPPVNFYTGFVFDIHTAATSLEDWKGKEWYALFSQDTKRYLCTCKCQDEVLTVLVYSLAQDPEPMQIVVKSPGLVGVEQSPMQVFIGRTVHPNQKEPSGLTVDLDQLSSFLHHEYRKVGPASCYVALVPITVLLGDPATESLHRL